MPDLHSGGRGFKSPPVHHNKPWSFSFSESLVSLEVADVFEACFYELMSFFFCGCGSSGEVVIFEDDELRIKQGVEECMLAQLLACSSERRFSLDSILGQNRIINDILDATNSNPKGKIKTGIMRDANLSLDQANRYLQHLELSGVIKPTNAVKSQELA